ncbi:HNH endonuclease [Pseudonocardia lacus]|jgi:hypothetical protein|uniref:HNH endonuclease n=1 Tax=Pseudonocardia lacus TaxID=2835865 RepID=UPI001BDC72A5|nr:hypothetical protein [Pseudonocardia lacus]
MTTLLDTPLTTAWAASVADETGGWTALRREVIDRDAGTCALCGRRAADTAFHSWEAGDLVAAHTRCVVGLGPPVAA